MKNNQLNSPENSLQELRSKNNKYNSQLKIFREYLRKKDASRLMIAVATGIPLQNVCRYVGILRKSNSIAVVRKDKCKISGEQVEFLTTDEVELQKLAQLSLF